MSKVFVVKDEKEVVEKEIEVIEEVLVFSGRSWWRGSNLCWHCNPRYSTHSSRSGRRSHRGRAFGTLVCGIGACGDGAFVVFWFVRQLL